MPPKKNHFEKQKSNLQLSLNIPLIPFGKEEKKGKNTPHSSPPQEPQKQLLGRRGKKSQLNSPLLLFKFSPLNP
jgi:hypothetical protein